ncbi:MAG: tyrosine-type recombinase/integrase [Sciscionella sp.]
MHSTPNPSGVRFTGPLRPFVAGLAVELATLGYTTTSATAQLQLAAHLSRWLESEGTGQADLTAEVLERFLAARRHTYASLYTLRALGPILGYLRRHGAVPALVAPGPSSPSETLLARYRHYLVGERCLSRPVADAYTHWVTPLVEARLDAGDFGFAGLTAEDVAGFLTAHLPAMSQKSAQMTACALRSFLRFLHEEQILQADLADAVPAVAHRRLSGLPQPLGSAEVNALLEACDRSDPVGRRDFAVITILHRLGLRCAETAALGLDDVDWQAGTLTIRGKGNRIDQLPLPVDVGQALVDYLRDGRPTTTARTLFVRAAAPHTTLVPSSLSCIVARAARRAGLGTIHAHRLRHTAASRTLNAGASLEEVSHLLRHASVATTSVYAKTDQTRLASLSRPWPITGGLS